MFKRIGVSFLLLSSSLAIADRDYRGVQYARVTEVTPVYQRIAYTVPEEQCWQEEVAVGGHRSATGPILGAIIGGALGNELGHRKSNKRVGVAVGAALGASLGNDIARNRSTGGHYELRERCAVSHREAWRDEVVGYDVRYRFQGEIYETRLPYNPGKEIEIEVNHRPLG